MICKFNLQQDLERRLLEGAERINRYICIYTYMYICNNNVYIYIYIEREIYIYIYIINYSENKETTMNKDIILLIIT